VSTESAEAVKKRFALCLSILTGIAQSGPAYQDNRLTKESSPYLLQHARNPVDWYPWGEEALERARKENKLIFLYVGYAACHWCHVMERESFEDKEIAKFLNDHFVCIKVDREERPDIDQIYMTAVQIMSGRGGWPMAAKVSRAIRPRVLARKVPTLIDRKNRARFGTELVAQDTRLDDCWRAL